MGSWFLRYRTLPRIITTLSFERQCCHTNNSPLPYCTCKYRDVMVSGGNLVTQIQSTPTSVPYLPERLTSPWWCPEGTWALWTSRRRLPQPGTCRSGTSRRKCRPDTSCRSRTRWTAWPRREKSGPSGRRYLQMIVSRRKIDIVRCEVKKNWRKSSNILIQRTQIKFFYCFIILLHRSSNYMGSFFILKPWLPTMADVSLARQVFSNIVNDLS